MTSPRLIWQSMTVHRERERGLVTKQGKRARIDTKAKCDKSKDQAIFFFLTFVLALASSFFSFFY